MLRKWLIAAVVAAPVVAAAQGPQAAPIKTTRIAGSVSMLEGVGGNIGVSSGPDGIVIIDDQYAVMSDNIRKALQALGPQPLKFIVNTHWHGDHTGGNENFGKAGALILAHDNVRIRMAQPQTRGGRTTPASVPVALPVVTYHDGLSLHLNGDEIRTYHMHDAHTDGDSIVVWKRANIVHMGDLFFNKVTLPFIDLDSGGSARGLLAAIQKTLTLTNAETKIIPGHGPVATEADLIAYRDMLRTVIGIVESGISKKQTLAQIQALKPAAKWEVAGGFISGDRFVEAIYKSLTAAAPAHVHGAGHNHSH